MDLCIQRIDSVEALASLRREWQRLADDCAEGLPFKTWEWHDAWWRHFREDRFQVRDSLFVRAVRKRSGDLAAIAPLVLTRRPSLDAIGVRVLDFMGSDRNVTELRGVLSEPSQEEEVHRALLAHLTECAREWDCVCWRGIRVGSASDRLLTAHPDIRVVDETPSYVLPLAQSWAAFKKLRPRNLKESLRKCYNSLRRDGHGFRLEIASAPEQIESALGHFFRLHRARANVPGGVPHPDVFASQASRGFLADVCRQLAARSAVRIFQLRVEDEIVASRVGFTSGDSLYLYYSGFDPRWSRYGVMTTTLAESIKHAIDAGIRSVNLSTGTDVSKTRWRPEKVAYRTLIQSSPFLRGRLAHFAYRCAREGRVHPRVRDVMVRLFGRRSEAA